MIIHRGIEQGTDEWLDLRLAKLTGSKFKDVLAKGRGNSPSKTRQSYLLQLAAEALTGEPTQSFTNEYMEWGTQTEPQARAMYELETGSEVEEVTFVTMDDRNIGVSPDGLVGDSGGVEFKCPKSTTQIETYLSGKMPPVHMAQVQGCLWVLEREWWDFVSFDPRINGAAGLFIQRIYRDDQYIQTLDAECKRFEDELAEMVEKLRKGK